MGSQLLWVMARPIALLYLPSQLGLRESGGGLRALAE